jgi:broad specificity phosphatase PhoE
MLKIMLVRHGETEWNKVHRLQGGDSDTPLNELGKKQAECIAIRLKDETLTAIYSSPLQRALNTAFMIAGYHNLDVNTLPDLKEIRVGKLEGADSLTMKLRWDHILCQGNEGEGAQYGVELIDDVQSRAWGAIKGMALKYPEGTIVVVTHYVVIMSIVCAILTLPLSQMVRLRLNPGSLTAFSMNSDGVARLELFNDVCHNIDISR